MVYTVGSLAPLFIVWAIQGEPKVDEKPLVPEVPYELVCITAAILPSLLLALRWRAAKINHDYAVVTVGKSTDSKDYLLVYLLAVLTPLYGGSYDNLRNWAAAIFILAVIVCLFWFFDLYHMNILFALRGYRTFVVQAHGDAPHDCERPIIVLSRKTYLQESKLHCIRLSNSVYIERSQE